jgi:hypothetical protein
MRNILVTHARDPLGVFENNGRQLFHFETLGIVPSNLVDIRNDAIKVNRVRVDDEIFGYH